MANRKRSIPRKIKKKGGKKRKRIVKKQKKIGLTKAIGHIKKQISQQKPNTLGDAIQVALKSAKNFKNKIKTSRVVKIPKSGGVLPLIPIFAALSALGGLSSGAATIASAVNKARAAKQQLEESQRHNKTMEAIAMGKGLYLKPYKTGLGLFLRPV